MPTVDWLGLVQLLAIGLFLAWSLMVWMTMHRLARPPGLGYGTRVARGLPGEPSELERPLSYRSWNAEADGSPVWEIECENRAGPVIVFTHGWGHARQDILDRIDAVRDRVRCVLAWDAPGHGEHPLRVSPLGTSEHRVLEELVDRAGELSDGGRVFLWGWSMGAGISIACAAESSRVSGVIAEGAFARLETPARNKLRLIRLPHRFTLGPALWLLGLSRPCGPGWRGFDRVGLAGSVLCPLLALHGTEDEISPYADGVAIAEAAPRGEVGEIAGGHHMDLWAEPWRERSAKIVRAFLDEHS